MYLPVLDHINCSFYVGYDLLMKIRVTKISAPSKVKRHKRQPLKPGHGQAPEGYYWSGKDWRPYTPEELEKIENENKSKEATF